MINWYNLSYEVQWKIVEEEMASFPIQAIPAASDLPAFVKTIGFLSHLELVVLDVDI